MERLQLSEAVERLERLERSDPHAEQSARPERSEVKSKESD